MSSVVHDLSLGHYCKLLLWVVKFNSPVNIICTRKNFRLPTYVTNSLWYEKTYISSQFLRCLKSDFIYKNVNLFKIKL